MTPNQKHDEYKVNLDLPYPPVQTESHQSEYAYAMLSNVGSNNSEMSAISLYLYNNIILNPDYTEIAKCFHDISIVEMHHLHIFATLSYQMGLDPRLWSAQNRGKYYWTPAYNRYPRALREVIENSLKGEEATIQKYTKQAETIHDTNIVDLLNRIILDEKHHVEIFHTMLDKIN